MTKLFTALATIMLVGCSSNDQPKPLVSYTPDAFVQQTLFTVGLEIKLVDAADRPISGVKVYARNPYFHQYVFTGQSGTALIDGTFSAGEMTLIEFEGPGIRWTEELYQELPAGTRLITLKMRDHGDGSVRLAALRYYPK